MILLLCHLTGDYVLQNQIMADRKLSAWTWAGLHAAIYSLSFAALLVLTASQLPALVALVVIFGTHALIDRMRVAGRWCRFYGVGTEGAIVGWWRRRRGYVLAEVVVKPDLVETRWVPGAVVRAFDDVAAEEGFDRAHAWVLGHSIPRVKDAPDFLRVWLQVIVDNTLHLAINAAAVYLATGLLP